MPRRMDSLATGRPDVNAVAENLEMRLELLNVSVFQMYMRDTLHQVDHGIFGIYAWERLHCCLHRNFRC